MRFLSFSRGQTINRLVRTRGRPSIVARAAGIALAANMAFASAALAQGVIAGTVVDAGNQQPIAGAQVTIETTTLGTMTDAGGRFRINNVPAGQLTLMARRIGYGSQSRTASAGDTTVAFELSPRALNLDQVIVTGTAGGEQKREIGNAVTQIDAATVLKYAPVVSFQDLLQGRAPNVAIMPGSGQVGTGSRIRVRGTSSLGLAQTPLMYVDGVRVNNAQSTGPVNQAFGSASISRWNDIDPEDIDHIDILKGPAAATLYGTEAANGVINIVTKHGTSERPEYNITVKQGANFLMNPSGRFPTNYQMVDGSIQSINYDQLRDSYGQDFFRNGRYQLYHGSMSGGTGLFQYYMAGTREQSQGAEHPNDLNRTSGRVNLTADISDKLTVQANATYLSGRTTLPAEAGYGGTVWSTILMDPATIPTIQKGFGSSTPEAYDAEYHLFQDVGKFTGGFTVTHKPTSWLSHRLVFGIDQTNTTDVELAERIDSLEAIIGSDATQGYLVRGLTDAGFRTFDYAATARFDLTPTITTSTSVGMQYYRRRIDATSVSGSMFAAPGQTSIDGVTQKDEPFQSLTANASLGYYAQEQIGWKDRRFLTLALRSDDNSAFGSDFDRVYYPKASVSWVLSEEPFWNASFINSLRLRAAYGETGAQPGAFTALRSYVAVAGPDGGAAVTPFSLGNPNLGPERGREFEAGADGSIWDDRLAVEFTYYNRRTTDAILDRQIAPSVGFASIQFINAGEIRNSGFELITRLTPVRNNTVTWDAQFAFASNSNKIIDLGIPGLDFVSAGQYVQHHEGYPVGSWFAKRVVSATLDADGTAIDPMCDDGNGGTVACDNAPDVFLGNGVPKREGSFSNTVTLWNKLRISGMLDFQRGQYKLDGNTRVRCLDISGRCPQIFFPERYSPVEVYGAQHVSTYPFWLIKNASFVKLREISVSYELPDQWAQAARAQGASITVQGRNLHTWTKYTGLEPEANFLGGSRGGSNAPWEQTVLPQLSSFVAAISLTF
ncbi:MAG TPA: SusC/RagA family TonB-linked outer membrane protein [Gemmatimonadaceae bacterium]